MGWHAGILATGWAELPGRLGGIFYFIVLPILLLAAIGWALQRFGGLDMPTLKRLNFYFVIPGVIYTGLVQSRLTASDAVTVVLFALAMQAALGALTYAAAVVRRVPRDRRNALVMTTIYYNSGNFGLPLQDLAFGGGAAGALAMTRQVFVMVTQNFTSFTIGVMLAAGGRKRQSWRQNLLHIAKLPPVYALLAAVVTIEVRRALGDHAPAVGEAIAPFWKTLTYVRGAFIGVALLTLGAQLGTVRRGGDGGRKYPVALSVFLRLLMGPAIGLGLVYAFGLRGSLAEMLLISTASPTAVNCMLLCLEFDNHPDFAARAVLYSTLLCPVTVTLVVFLAQSGLLPGG
ncbi:MAG TPA: AEC family transporter [Phycisphaerae bacterium]|nr:AEC family transporter [Phycisphaerae bacterium]